MLGFLNSKNKICRLISLHLLYKILVSVYSLRSPFNNLLLRPPLSFYRHMKGKTHKKCTVHTFTTAINIHYRSIKSEQVHKSTSSAVITENAQPTSLNPHSTIQVINESSHSTFTNNSKLLGSQSLPMKSKLTQSSKLQRQNSCPKSLKCELKRNTPSIVDSSHVAHHAKSPPTSPKSDCEIMHGAPPIIDSSKENIPLGSQCPPTTSKLTSSKLKRPLTPSNTTTLCTSPKSQQIHSTAGRTCHYCGKSYAFSSGLSQHMAKEHSNKSKAKGYLMCNQCNSR